MGFTVCIFQALLTGLTVMTPRDPWQFVRESLAHIREANVTDVPRYMEKERETRS